MTQLRWSQVPFKNKSRNNRGTGIYMQLISLIQMWCFERFGTIRKILKTWKTPMQKYHFYFTKNNTHSWVFFTFLKFYKWHQIAQSVSNILLSQEQLCTATNPSVTRSHQNLMFKQKTHFFGTSQHFKRSRPLRNLLKYNKIWDALHDLVPFVWF